MAKIARCKVFIAILDPDPRNSGAGVKMLEQAGIAVSVGLLEDDALKDLEPYLSRGEKMGSGT